MAIDSLGISANEYRRKLLLRNLVNSDDGDRIVNLTTAIAVPQQYTTQQSDLKQFVSSAISIKDLVEKTFKGEGNIENTSTRSFINQDYTSNRPYPLGTNDNSPLQETNIVDDPETLIKRGTYEPGSISINSNTPQTQGLSKAGQSGVLEKGYWEQNNNFNKGNKRDLLSFTQDLLKGVNSSSVGKVIDQTQTTYQNPNGQGLDKNGDENFYTKGSNVRDIDNPALLAREFTVEKPYSTVGDLIRNEAPYTIKDKSHSSLDENGFARIAPKKGDKLFLQSGKSSVTNLMFALENLAWKDYESLLPCGEAGPNGGRVMWFPPYAMNITDNSSVNWTNTQFVGRGEPIYTYNNAERSLTLQFKVIVDHPSILNAVKNDRKISVDQYFGATSGKLNTNTIRNQLNISYEKIKQGMSPGEIDSAEVVNAQGITIGVVNSSFSLPKNVEPQTVYYSADTISFIDNVTGNTKNSSFDLDGFIDDLYSVIELMDINMTSNTSLGYTLSSACLSIPKDTSNLAEDRYNDAILYIKDALTAKLPSTNPPVEKQIAINNINTTTTTNFKNSNGNGCEPIEFQSLNIKVQYNPAKDRALRSVLPQNELVNAGGNNLLLKRTVPLCELDYFEAMDKDSRVALYGSLKEQLRYFSPAFHSITPEGFNNRLTFLLQCTRQGPSIQKTSSSPSNMAFGRPPVCVLRIGDFYHTKVVIDSVNIGYDDALWDLNADGIGIQPMIATVDLNMKVIGGSSLTGPINKLQNALSHHFFANTEVFYDVPEEKIEPEKIDPIDVPPLEPLPESPPIVDPLPLPEPFVPPFSMEGTYILGCFGANSFCISCPKTDMDGLPQFTQRCEDYYIENRFKTHVTYAIDFSGTTSEDYTFKTTIRDTDGKTPDGGTVTQEVSAGSIRLIDGKILDIYLEFDKKYYLTTSIIQRSDFLLVSKQVELTKDYIFTNCPLDVPDDNCVQDNPFL